MHESRKLNYAKSRQNKNNVNIKLSEKPAKNDENGFIMVKFYLVFKLFLPGNVALWHTSMCKTLKSLTLVFNIRPLGYIQFNLSTN